MKVLIAIDLQNDFISGALGTKEAEAIVSTARSLIESFEGPILYTLDTHSEAYLKTEEGRALPVPHCIEGTEGWQIEPTILKALEVNSAIAVTKNTFGGKNLIPLLQEYEKDGIESIEFLGICTDICVVSNVLLVKSFFPEIPLIVHEPACAGVTPATHEAAITVLKSCLVQIQRS